MRVKEYLIRQIRKLGDNTEVEWNQYSVEILLKRIEMLEKKDVEKEIN